MARTTLFPCTVHFGDCDPAGIVFFPNFLRWMDAASLDYFMQCGIPPWRELVRTEGILGTPALEVSVKFLKPATYGEQLEIHTRIDEWRGKVFVQQHRVLRGEELLCEGTILRAFVTRHPDDPERMRAIVAPAHLRARTEQAP